MRYKSFNLSCSDHGNMKYVGKGNYVCSVCGRTYHDDDYEGIDTGERLSVYDAAVIWASHGKDPDYMFGYSEEELESAL